MSDAILADSETGVISQVHLPSAGVSLFPSRDQSRVTPISVSGVVSWIGTKIVFAKGVRLT
jgi:hypothetical protein